ncbi:carbohydrate kinase [Mesorhizobium sp. L-8-10]|uniref:carbohydrate kinase family protein n=1 Tax=Mesorhizobium sp. L-8-10 TaxID=2744523 RepID=UPI0019280EB6|nr:carbohydrate kinase family protein [Mesorhizobium sp. L-8-10]BCH34251.1 carbohydrate kinase [Mesorhizobium sp. L-8-10]
MTTPAILLFGNANVDLVLGEIDGWPAVGTETMVERSETRPGGSAGNMALALSGIGVPHLFIGSTGDDANGAWLRSQFDPRFCKWIIDGGDTTVTVGIVHRGGDRVFFTTPGHLQAARIADLLKALPPAPHDRAVATIAGGFLMPDIAAGTARLLWELSALGWRTAIDPGWPPSSWDDKTRTIMAQWLGLADYALLNAEEIKGFTGIEPHEHAAAAVAGMLKQSQALVLKMGPEGARAYRGGETFAVQAPEVRVIDTVGAGDTFNAAFLAALVEGADLHAALSSGVETAARAISTFPRRYDAG